MDTTQHQQKLLIWLLLAAQIGGIFIIAFAGLLNPEDLTSREVIISAGSILMLGIFLVAAWRGHFLFPAAGFILLSAITFLAIAYLAAPALLPFILVPVILTSIFFRTGHTIMVAIVLALIIFLLNRQIGQENRDFWDMQSYLYFFIFSSGLIVVFTRHLQNMEALRRRRLEAANQSLRESERLLEQRVQERTAELQAAYEQVTALNQAKDEFVSNVSHELRTPVTSIKIHHELLQQELAETPNRHLEILQRETERLQTLIESLLLLSRFDQERVKFHFDRVDLNQLAEQYGRDRKAVAVEKELHLVQELCPACLVVNADLGMLSLAISILLTNALNYTPAGGQVTISTHRRGHSTGIQGGICLQDTGPGISPEEKEHLFERFYRGSAAHENGVEGTGLGLAIAQQIVLRHQGLIEVESSGIPGEGTRFTVWVPLIAEEKPEPKPQQNSTKVTT